MATIHIVGLGPGDAGLITLDAWQLMSQTKRLILRTAIHPSVARLDEACLAYEALDRFYETEATFEEVYGHIVDYVLAAAQKEDVVYAVPGSPVVAERTVQLLEEKGAGAGVTVDVLPGMSFLEVMYTRLRFDPVGGVTIIDSSDADSLPKDLQTPLIVTQVYDRRVASDVKLSLMDLYGDEYEAQLIYHISLPDEDIRTIKLYELDRIDTIDHLTSLFLCRLWIRLQRREMMQQTQKHPASCPLICSPWWTLWPDCAAKAAARGINPRRTRACAVFSLKKYTKCSMPSIREIRMVSVKNWAMCSIRWSFMPVLPRRKAFFRHRISFRTCVRR